MVSNSESHILDYSVPAILIHILFQNVAGEITQDKFSFDGGEYIKEFLELVKGKTAIMFLNTTGIRRVKEKKVSSVSR